MKLTFHVRIHKQARFLLEKVLPMLRLVPPTRISTLPGSAAIRSEKGWITAEIFEKYFDKILPNLPQGQPILLLIDGHSSHFSLQLLKKAQERNVHIFCFPAHLTHLLQPFEELQNVWHPTSDSKSSVAKLPKHHVPELPVAIQEEDLVETLEYIFASTTTPNPAPRERVERFNPGNKLVTHDDIISEIEERQAKKKQEEEEKERKRKEREARKLEKEERLKRQRLVQELRRRERVKIFGMRVYLLKAEQIATLEQQGRLTRGWSVQCEIGKKWYTVPNGITPEDLDDFWTCDKINWPCRASLCCSNVNQSA